MTSKMPAIVGDQFAQMIDRFKDLDAVKLQQVIDAFSQMQDRQTVAEDRQAKADFNESFTQLLADIPPVVRDKVNPLFKSRYSSHEAIMEALRPVMMKYGIGARFGSEATGKPNIARPFLVLFKGLYSETHSIDISVAAEGPKGGRPAMNDAQALGSGMTYARKYLLANAFNITFETDDDDGNGVGRRPRSGLMDQNVRQAVKENVAGEQAQGNGNGSGKPTLREWFDAFQADCDAADTVEECETILKREEVMNCQEVFKKYPDTLAAIEEIKRGMMKRIYQGDDAASRLIP